MPHDPDTHDDVPAYLAGLEFPASKLDVIATAEANGAPQDLIERLQRLDRERVEDPAQLAAPR